MGSRLKVGREAMNLCEFLCLLRYNPKFKAFHMKNMLRNFKWDRKK